VRKKSIGHAFSDHVFEEHFKRRRGFGGGSSKSFLRFIPLIVLVAIFGVLFARLFTLQVVRASYYSRLSDENRIRTVLIPAPRGIIFDRNNQALVRNTPAFTILEGKEVKWLSQDEALEKIANKEPVVSTVKREYLLKDAAAHVLGYIGQISEKEVLLPEFQDYGLSDFTGRMGLEEQYERLLHGQNGRQLYEVNAKGERIRLLGEDEPREGGIINTTLDGQLQKVVHEAMRDAEKGAVVITDPRNGEILALYSKPTFDPNLFTREESYKPEGQYQKKEDILLDDSTFPLVNRAIAGVYPPGSTFKLITSIAGLETHSVTEDTEIEDTGVVSIGGINFGTWNYLQNGRKEGFMDMRGALRRSNDIYFYKISEKIGEEALDRWSFNFGLGKVTGIDLPGEVKGTVPGVEWKKEVLNENWYLGDTYNMSIGQGYLEATPLQVNLYTQIVANGGEMYQPHLMKEGGKLLKENVASQEYLAIVREGMRQACEAGGTAYPFFDFKVKNDKLPIDGLDYVADSSGSAKMTRVAVGCKTGTAESHGFDQEPHASFTVFAPFYNPEIVVTVLVENGGEGSSVAAPIAKEILTKYFERKN